MQISINPHLSLVEAQGVPSGRFYTFGTSHSLAKDWLRLI